MAAFRSTSTAMRRTSYMVRGHLIQCLLLALAMGRVASVWAQDSAAVATNADARIERTADPLMSQVPADFPRFTFASHPEQAQLLSHYLWHHFHHRLGNSPTLFNKEYVLTSDICSFAGNARALPRTRRCPSSNGCARATRTTARNGGSTSLPKRRPSRAMVFIP